MPPPTASQARARRVARAQDRTARERDRAIAGERRRVAVKHHGRAEVGSDHRHPQLLAACVLELGPAERELEARGPGGVAHQQVRGGERDRIERSPRRDSEVSDAAAAEVLDRRARAAAANDEAPHRGAKRTRSPGKSSAGGEAVASNRRTSVIPMRFQPPGVADG